MLPHRFVRSLTAVETRRIAELFRSAPQPRVRRRANTIRLSSLGYTVTQIAEVDRRCVLVLDNASYHTSVVVREYLREAVELAFHGLNESQEGGLTLSFRDPSAKDLGKAA